jgi:hypothetical protein
MAERDDDEMRDESDEVIELTCPACGASVRVPEAQAAREMKARCKNGHEFPIARALS